MGQVKKIAVGRYARFKDAARIDMIGKVIRHVGDCHMVVQVPNWTADGQALCAYGTMENIERSSAKKCREAAARRHNSDMD